MLALLAGGAPIAHSALMKAACAEPLIGRRAR